MAFGRIAGTEVGYMQDQYNPLFEKQRKEQRELMDPELRAKREQMDGVQNVLGVAGMLPVVGSFADIANTGISLMRGDIGGAAMNAVFAIPGIGDALQITRAGVKGAQKIGKMLPF